MSTELQPGQALAGGRYVIEELVGRGGMAVVHRARDVELGRTVAVKTMEAALAGDPSARERFRREARAVARLSHPHVVAVFDVGEELMAGARIPYFVMEYLPGRPLSTIVPSRPGELELGEVLLLVSQVLSALAASHAEAMVHRDIKPANVMVGPDGHAKVMDFGIAHALDQSGTALTGTGMFIGTPHYMAPEQFEGSGIVDTRADQYAVGVLLVQLLTGVPPFDGDSGMRIAYLHVTMPPPTLAELGASVPRAVEELVARALAKDPRERFPDVSAMREAVDRVRGEGGSAHARTEVDSGGGFRAPSGLAAVHAAKTHTAGPLPSAGPAAPPSRVPAASAPGPVSFDDPYPDVPAPHATAPVGSRSAAEASLPAQLHVADATFSPPPAAATVRTVTLAQRRRYTLRAFALLVVAFFLTAAPGWWSAAEPPMCSLGIWYAFRSGLALRWAHGGMWSALLHAVTLVTAFGHAVLWSVSLSVLVSLG